MGQLITLISDQLVLPPIAALGFIEAFGVMLLMIWLANKYLKGHNLKNPEQAAAGSRA